jgi:hypothetical protein
MCEKWIENIDGGERVHLFCKLFSGNTKSHSLQTDNVGYGRWNAGCSLYDRQLLFNFIQHKVQSC